MAEDEYTIKKILKKERKKGVDKVFSNMVSLFLQNRLKIVDN